jgi:hypothetical protein
MIVSFNLSPLNDTTNLLEALCDTLRFQNKTLSEISHALHTPGCSSVPEDQFLLRYVDKNRLWHDFDWLEFKTRR